jgi:electron transfer flavoprotein alpha subunit
MDQEELSILGAYGATKRPECVSAEGGLDNQVFAPGSLPPPWKRCGAKVLVMANNNSGKALAPRLSVRLKAGLVPGVTSALPESVSPLVVNKKVFSGKAFGNHGGEAPTWPS